ncbi:hypothetical protein M9H77_12269 [Catharanthus roseus]|uniref:Uncharacterized protein n=1 Tax=Catharanthus roseus TaxID=4058 RepID=A0ACC0BGY9_CATRO|nr:hypothetical protein M9H77_12269 [Catharanthus roseus]
MTKLCEIQEPPLYVPLHPCEGPKEDILESDVSPVEQVQQAVDCLHSSEGMLIREAKLNFNRWSVMDYARAYGSGEITPSMVAERLIAAIKESSGAPLQMSFFINFDSDDILKQAKESSHRYERGEPISLLDGVPIAIKDEIDCLPYPTTGMSTL